MEAKKETNKLSYEELERVALQLNAQVKNLVEQLESERNNNNWGRMSVLLECVAHSEVFENKDFISKCCKEIEDRLYPEPETLEE